MKITSFYNFIKENKDIDIISDYFLELSDYKDHGLPIRVNIYSHKINSTEKIDGYKITIFYDIYDSEYVKKCLVNIIKRLSGLYKIHYNQISKSGNGYYTKDVRVYGSDVYRTVQDPIWKHTITLSPKKNKSLSESNEFNDLIEDVEDSIYLSEKSFLLKDSKLKEVKFDLLLKRPFGQNPIGGEVRYTLYYGNMSNSDFISKGKNFANGCTLKIKIKNTISKNIVQNIFSRIINKRPNILIWGKFLAVVKELDGKYYNEYRIIFVDINI